MGDDDDEDDRAIENSKREQNYARQFLDYEEQFDAALLKSTEQLQVNRQSVCSKFLLKKSTANLQTDQKESPMPKNPFKAREKSPVVRDDEVTDILDDNDIISPLMQSLPKDQI